MRYGGRAFTTWRWGSIRSGQVTVAETVTPYLAARLVTDSLGYMTPEEALALARELHGDQVDKLGEDYVDGHLSTGASGCEQL